jgi:hypothetical protein
MVSTKLFTVSFFMPTNLGLSDRDGSSLSRFPFVQDMTIPFLNSE